nr:G protein-coupled receptor [Proales similis]
MVAVLLSVWMLVLVRAEFHCPVKFTTNIVGCEMNTDCDVLERVSDTHKLRLRIKDSFQGCCEKQQSSLQARVTFSRRLALTNEFNISDWLRPSDTIECFRKTNQLKLRLANVAGFDASFSTLQMGHVILSLRFSFTHLRLLYDYQTSEVRCRNQSSTRVFRPSSVIGGLGFEFGNVYDQNTCSELFMYAHISTLWIWGVIKSSVKRNLLGFTETVSAHKLKSFIETVRFKGYELDVSARLYSPSVFRHTFTLDLSGTVHSFEPNLLVDSRLRKIVLNVVKLRRFLHNNIAWLNKAGERKTDWPLKVHLQPPLGRPDASSEFGEKLFHQRNSIQFEMLYQIEDGDNELRSLFDDSSFCLFYKPAALDVELEGLVFEKAALKTCSCTLVWIMKNHFNEGGNNQYRYLYHKWTACLEQRLQLELKCDFEQMKSKCVFENLSATVVNQQQYMSTFSFYDFMLEFQLYEYVVRIYAQPLISALAVVANALIIYTFRRNRASAKHRSNKLKDKNRRMWDYVYLNSYFTLLQAAVFTLGPVTSCIEYGGIYCSPWILSRFSQLFYLLVESYAGNVLRLMANVSNSMFVLYRFALNRDCWYRLRAWRPRSVIAVSLAICSLTSAIRLFVNERFNVNILFEHQFDYLSRNNLDAYNQSVVLQVVSMFNLFSVGVLFVAVNICVDIRLLNYLRAQKAENRKEDAESRITKMIILNGFFSLLFRLPEIAVSFLMLVFTFDAFTFPACVLLSDPTHSACAAFANLAKFFYTFSLFESFVLLILFNKSFRREFIQIIHSNQT